MGLLVSLMRPSVLVVVTPLVAQLIALQRGAPPEFLAPLFHGAQLTRFYSEHAPSNSKNVPQLVVKHKGEEAQLFARLEKKYSTKRDSDPWRIDLLSACDAASNFGSQLASERFPPFKKVVDRWMEIPTADRVWRAALGALGLSYLSSPLRASGRLRNFVVLLPLTLAATVGPSPELMEAAALYSAFINFWASLDLYGRLAGVTALCFGASALTSGRARVLVLFAWVCCSMKVLNPVSALRNDGAIDAETLARIGCAATAAEARKALATLPNAAFRIHDFGVLSVVTHSRGAFHAWTSPVAAIGVGGGWVALTQVAVSGAAVEIFGLACPLWIFPLGFIAALRATLWLAAEPPSRAI
ncbi:hypothetical protein M885DRAFT_532751 [Pelagophyceae sp. CCMP2097]|nr:hypothetical protein M885DRAFT_532751 [Pelagophyceae sp. CCMP2097]